MTREVKVQGEKRKLFKWTGIFETQRDRFDGIFEVKRVGCALH
ncbi:hypothetical protein DSC45_35190 [Streptomyces sp. YIM 130001]|nr:hypothetical protein DSC45_35190 [Streptomyces sp. YIM 130001]